MKGYSRMLISDFLNFDALAAEEFNKRFSPGCDNYTYYLPDADELYCWARIEHDWATSLPILTFEDALQQGLMIPLD